jgi:hypothetical protein
LTLLLIVTKASLKPTPFISVTPDPLRALNRATELESDGYKNIEVILIDGWNLHKANVVHCNELRKVLKLEPDPLFETEYLVWKRIPSTAILRRWPWDTLRSTLGLCFPSLVNLSFPAPRKRPLAALRNQLCSGDPGPSIETLVEILIDKLDLLPQNLTTKQIAMMMLGWTRCKSDTRYFKSLEKDLQDIIPEQIAELDYRLYAKTCQWNKDRQQPYVRTFDGDLEDLKRRLKTAREFNIPSYDDWLTERNLTEEWACTEIESVELEKWSLLSILSVNGGEIPALSFRLPPSPRQRRILKRCDIYGLNP